MTDRERHLGLQMCEPGATISVRPTLALGLGGTGVLAIEWYHHLVRQLFDNMPSFIRLMAIDTDEMEDIGPPGRFPKSDFYNVFHEVHLGDIIRDFEDHRELHPHLQWLDDLDLPSAVTERGAQGVPRLGRVVFFETAYPVIYPALLERFEALNNPRLRKEVAALPPAGQFQLAGSPVIHLAASICGGTGAGFLLDLAYALQAWSKEVFNRPAELIAHLILPDGFRVQDPEIMAKLRAVAGTKLKEIEWTMDKRRSDKIAVQYPNGYNLDYRRKPTPFNLVYLVNGFAPQGGDTREELAEMVGRVLRAMTIEPCSEPINSTTNNTQIDALCHEDKTSKRLRCFSSYGLQYGIVKDPTQRGIGHRLVRQWIFDTIARLGKAEFADEKERTAAQRTAQGAIDDGIGRDASRIRSRMPAVELPSFDFVPPGQGQPEDVEREFVGYLSDFVGQHLIGRTEADAEQVMRDLGGRTQRQTIAHIQKPEEPLYEAQRFLPKAKLSLRILGDLRRNARRRPPMSHAALQRGVQNMVHRLLEDVRSQRGEGSVGSLIMSLFNLNTSVKVPSSRTQGGEQNDVFLRDRVRELLEDTRGRFQDVAAQKFHIQALDTLCQPPAQDRPAGYFHKYTERLTELAQAASYLLHTGHEEEWELQTQTQSSQGLTRLLFEQPYATSLLELNHPDNWIRSLSEEDITDVHQTRQVEFHELVRRTIDLFTALPNDPPSSRNEHLERLFRRNQEEQLARDEMLRERLVRQREELHVNVLDWIREFYTFLSDEFYRPVDKQDPSRHSFFEPVREMVESARSKIAVDHRHRHSTTKTLIVSQHPRGSAVRQLLRSEVGQAFREAHVDKSFIRDTDVWFQLLQFEFGFSADALDNFERYDEALDRYKRALSFVDDDDLWLDPTWARKYEAFVKNIDEEKRQDKLSVAENAAKVRAGLDAVKTLVGQFFSGAIDDCQSYEFGEQTEGMDCISEIKLTRGSCDRLLEESREKLDHQLSQLAVESDEIADLVLVQLYANYIEPRSPLFASFVKPRFDQFRDDYGRLLKEQELR